MSRVLRRHLMAVALVAGSLVAGCGGREASDAAKAPPEKPAPAPAKPPARPEVRFELSEPAVTRIGIKTYNVQMAYKLVAGQIDPDKWYMFNVSFNQGGASIQRRQGKELEAEGAIEWTCRTFSDEATEFKLSIAESNSQGGPYRPKSNELAGQVDRPPGVAAAAGIPPVANPPTTPPSVEPAASNLPTLQKTSARAVERVAFWPDGSKVVARVGPVIRGIQLWDVRRRTMIRQLDLGDVDKFNLNAVAVSPNGKTLALNNYEQVELWDTATWRRRKSWTGHDYNIMSLQYSPDGRRLAAGYMGEWGIKIWDSDSGDNPQEFQVDDTVWGLAFSPDGKTLASAGEHNTAVVLWDLQTEDVLQEWGNPHRSYCVAYSRDGRLVAGASRVGRVFVWDVASGKLIHQFQPHEEIVTSVVFTKDGRFLISAGGPALGSDEKPRICVANLETGEVGMPIEDHSANVTCLAMDPQGEHLVSGDFAGYLGFWRVSELIERAFGDDAAPPDQQSGAPVLAHALSGHADPIWSCAISPDGRHGLTGDMQGAIILWDLTTGREVWRSNESPGVTVLAAAFSPDGKQFVTSGPSADELLRVWNLDSKREAFRLSSQGEQPGPHFAVAYSPDGRVLLTGRQDGTLQVWDLAGRRPVRRCQGHEARARSIAFSPNRRHFASGGADGSVRLWDASSGAAVRVIAQDLGRVMALSFSPDGRSLLVADLDHPALRLLDVATGEVAGELKGHERGNQAAAFLPDGKRAVSAGTDGTVRVWDVAARRQTARIDAGSPVRGMAVSADGRQILTGGTDGVARLWRLPAADAVNPEQ